MSTKTFFLYDLSNWFYQSKIFSKMHEKQVSQEWNFEIECITQKSDLMEAPLKSLNTFIKRTSKCDVINNA